MARKAKHTGAHPASCPACITLAETQRFYWEHDYLSVLARKGAEQEFRARHNAAIARQAKNEAMSSMGLKKVKGALGGTYWE